MNVLTALLFAQLAAGAQEIPPVLAFPEPGMDDSTAYQGYRTRFLRDAAGNVVQVYINQRHGRVVNLWADAANASASFSVRDEGGVPAAVTWGSSGAAVGSSNGTRWVEYRLTAAAPSIVVGAFLLGSMRLERDFQYAEGHLAPFGSAEAEQPELLELISNLERLPATERSRHLGLLRATGSDDLRARMRPSVRLRAIQGRPLVRVEQTTFDGRNTLALQLTVENGVAALNAESRAVTIRAAAGGPIRLLVRIESDAPTLGPLSADEIFNDDFLAFIRRAREGGATGGAAATRWRRLDRQVRGMELMSYEDKLMAGLPNYATYFGRDMIMSALMLELVWSPAMLEHVIAAVLRKLGAGGDVSHEEALGGQAIRENASEYNARVGAYLAAIAARRSGAADSLLADARRILADLQAVRENYHMVDDDFQLPVLAARYLGNPAISPERKRSFLNQRDSAKDATRLSLLLANLAYVVQAAEPYARDPRATNLVSFARRPDGRWAAQSWRDSGAGYGNGRFAMDINAVWVPEALAAMDTIVRVLRSLGLAGEAPALAGGSPAALLLRDYLADPGRLASALRTWRDAARHFQVELSAAEARRRAEESVATLPADERAYWMTVMDRNPLERDAVRFMALALDSTGAPIPVANTDPATALFLGDLTDQVRAGARSATDALRQLDVFLLSYPFGLYVPGLGPLVANDVYAPTEVQAAFRQDLYHSPRVVWGREVNLLLLGLARQISSAFDDTGRLRDARLQTYVLGLENVLNRTLAAVEESGLKHNELWTYTIEDGRLVPVRYGASTDIQLWNLTDLAVQFALDRLRARGRGN